MGKLSCLAFLFTCLSLFQSVSSAHAKEFHCNIDLTQQAGAIVLELQTSRPGVKVTPSSLNIKGGTFTRASKQKRAARATKIDGLRYRTVFRGQILPNSTNSSTVTVTLSKGALSSGDSANTRCEVSVGLIAN